MGGEQLERAARAALDWRDDGIVVCAPVQSFLEVAIVAEHVAFRLECMLLAGHCTNEFVVLVSQNVF
jgi:hypothetical protein